MLPDLVAVHQQPRSRPEHGAVRVLHAVQTTAMEPGTGARFRLRRAAGAFGRTAFAIAAGATCALMLIGVVINLLGTTP